MGNPVEPALLLSTIHDYSRQLTQTIQGFYNILLEKLSVNQRTAISGTGNIGIFDYIISPDPPVACVMTRSVCTNNP